MSNTRNPNRPSNPGGISRDEPSTRDQANQRPAANIGNDTIDSSLELLENEPWMADEQLWTYNERPPSPSNRSAASSLTRNPNVLTTAPRPGGYMADLAEISEAQNEQGLNAALGIVWNEPMTSDRSRLYEGFQNLQNWMLTDSDIDVNAADILEESNVAEDNNTPERRQPTNQVAGSINEPRFDYVQGGLTKDYNYVMSIAISTIMMIAADPTITPPSHHLTWTMDLLNTIKDDQNNDPMNIRGIKMLLRATGAKETSRIEENSDSPNPFFIAISPLTIDDIPDFVPSATTSNVGFKPPTDSMPKDKRPQPTQRRTNKTSSATTKRKK